MPSGIIARGVGDTGDLEVRYGIEPATDTIYAFLKPGVFYSDNVRRFLYADAVYENLGANNAWMNRFILSRPAATPVLARARIRIGSVWKDLTPLYNAVVMNHVSYWQQRVDGLWETPVDLVYPLKVYDVYGNGYYQVDEFDDIGEHSYFFDRTRRYLIAMKPGLLMDGLRTSPTVEVYERVYPDGNKLRTRWNAAVVPSNPQISWAYAMYGDKVIAPDSIEGNVWTFAKPLDPVVWVVRYFVMNTFCLFGNVLEVFTEICDDIYVEYDAADTTGFVEFNSFAGSFLRGTQLLCASAEGASRTSPPALTNRVPTKLEMSVLEDTPFGPPGVMFTIGVTALDSAGRPVPRVPVTFSSTRSDVTFAPVSGETDMFGEISTNVYVTGSTGPCPITAQSSTYGLSVTRDVGLIGAGSSRNYVAVPLQVYWERISRPERDLDELILLFFHPNGAPVNPTSVTVQSVSGHMFRVPDAAGDLAKYTFSQSNMHGDGVLLIFIPKEPLSLDLVIRNEDIDQFFRIAEV
ncbi:MAG: hypothetical protein KatS3mg023_3731 [Armatimonadota bacterium]|nr:MAG: hypothetical protein KatS3mg023_3731 [Armatimonadota bacterium]